MEYQPMNLDSPPEAQGYYEKLSESTVARLYTNPVPDRNNSDAVISCVPAAVFHCVTIENMSNIIF